MPAARHDDDDNEPSWIDAVGVYSLYINAFKKTINQSLPAFSLSLSLSLYIYIYISCRSARMDLPDPLSPPVSFVHRPREVFQATSCIGIDLL